MTGWFVLLSAGTGPRIEIVIPLALRSVEPSFQSGGRLASSGIALQAAVRQAVRSPDPRRTTKPSAAAARTTARRASHGAAPVSPPLPGSSMISPNAGSDVRWGRPLGRVAERRGLVRLVGIWPHGPDGR